MSFLGLTPIFREIKLLWYSWAQREISPDNPDAHYIYRRIIDLKAERNAL